MATAMLSAYSVISFPAVQTPEEISQNEITLLLSLQSRAAQLEKQIDAAENAIMDRLRLGASVEDGQHSASIKESSRRSVSWRDVAERLAVRAFGHKKGELYCPRVLASTKPSKSYSLEIA
jgi:type II secretory pathway component PulJ